jgi:hypothetical protein
LLIDKHRKYYLPSSYARIKLFCTGYSDCPLEPWLMTPTLNAVAGSPEARYYKAHSTARKFVERLNGAINSRWSCINGQHTLYQYAADCLQDRYFVRCAIATFHRVLLSVPFATI